MIQLLIGLVSSLLVIGSVDAATYYVGTSGSDTTGDGSSGNRWRNPQKCVSIVVAGDTCIIGDGTYTDTDGDGLVLYISASRSANAGTVGNPITFKSENLHGAKLRVPAATTTSTYGIRITVAYHVIEGFEITDDGIPTTQGAASGISGIGFGESSSPIGIVIRRNHIHDIARSVCSDSTIGNTGINGLPGAGTTVEYNSIHTIGRKRNGESGCVTTRYHLDHGIYAWNLNTFTVHHNLFYDNSRGYDITIYKGGGQVSTGVFIYNNTFTKPTLTDPQPFGCINFNYTNTNVQVKNNIFNNCPFGYALFWAFAATQTNVVLDHNLSDSADADMQNPGGKPAGVTDSNNLVGSSSINFKNVGTNDYTLLSGSAAIDAGTAVGYAANGANPTIGAFDPPRFASCEVPSAATGTIRVTYTNNTAPPMLPASGATGYTARRNGAGNTITSTGKSGDNIIQLTVTNSYAGGDTVDISKVVGNDTDSLMVGGNLNQASIFTLTNQTCTNNAAGATYTITQSRYELHGAVGTESNPVILPHGYATTGAAENFVGYTVFSGGKIRIRFALLCGVTNCDPLGFQLWYALNGGSYTVVSDTYSSDNIAMCGSIPGNPTNGAPTTNQLSTAGTFVPGGFLSLASAIPTISGFNNGFKTEMEYCVRFDSDAAGFYEFRVRKQDGTVLDTYTVTPRIDIVPFAFRY